MNRALRPLAVGALLAVAVAAPLPAHGGQYRGPGTPSVPLLPRGVPGTGGVPVPTTPGPGTPVTGAGPVILEEAGWQLWWEFNKDPFVQQEFRLREVPVTGSDDFYLGTRRAEARTPTLQPTDAELRDRVVPALVALMEKERNRDVQTACLMALGKIGLDGPGIELEQVLAARIPRPDQEVRETAVLALGVAGRPKAAAMLVALLGDTAEGRRLAARTEVDDRTRSFAAYGLGLLARRSGDAAVLEQAHDALLAILRDRELKSRDLRVAAANGLGLLRDPGKGGSKRLVWRTVEELLAWYQQDLGRSDEALQAHAPVAIGRLLGRGTSPLHQRCKEHFAATLVAANKRSNPILQSSALALGMLAVPSTEHAEDELVEKALRTCFEKGVDRLAKYYAVMAMGRIGGAPQRDWLLATFHRANKNTERPWLSLALGLIAAAGEAQGEVDVAVAELLRDELRDAQLPDVRGALVVAIGMTRHKPMLPALQEHLRDSEHDETLAGYCCVGLAMLGDQAAVPTLTAVLDRSKRRPFLLLQAAVGLGCLADVEANNRLLAMMRENDSAAVLAALANAIGQIGDRRAIDPLIEMMRDEELTKIARAFVAAGLGGVGDRAALPWNHALSRDSNYAAPVDTLTNGATGVLDIL